MRTAASVAVAVLTSLLVVGGATAAPAFGPTALNLPAAVTDSAAASFADSLQDAYARQDVGAVRDLLKRADTQAEKWLARYRLYPLTEEEEVLGDPPSDPDDVSDPSAQTLAVLSGIWAYKAGETNMFNAMRYGRRSVSFLDAARAVDDTDPYVLLVEGQSLLFRPSIAGKDVPGAVESFRTLVDVLTSETVPGVALAEAKTWLWLALKENGQDEDAAAVREAVIAESPPSLYRQFLDDPPEV